MTDTSTNGKALYLRLLRHVLPHRRTFALGVVAMIVLGLTEPAIPAILEKVVGSFEQQMLDSVPLHAALFLGLFLVRGLSSFLSVFALESVAARVVQDLRKAMFDRLMRIPAPAYDNVSSGSLISKVTFDAQQVTDAATHAVTTIVRDSVAALGLLGWMLWIDWKLTCIALATAPAVIAVVVYFSRRLRRMAHGLQRTMGDLTHVMRCVRTSRSSARTSSCSTTPSPRTSPMAQPPAHRPRRSSPPRAPRTPWSSSRRCRGDSTRSSASEA